MSNVRFSPILQTSYQVKTVCHVYVKRTYVTDEAEKYILNNFETFVVPSVSSLYPML